MVFIWSVEMCLIFVAQINVIFIRPLYKAVILCNCIIKVNIQLSAAPFWNCYMGQVMRKCILCHMRTTKAQISLRVPQSDQHFCCSLLRKTESYHIKHLRRHIFAWCGSYNTGKFDSTSFCLQQIPLLILTPNCQTMAMIDQNQLDWSIPGEDR